MNNQPRLVACSAAIGAVGVAGVIAWPHLSARFGDAGDIAGAFMGGVAMLSFFVLGMALLSWLGKARLRRGKGVIARWRVSAAEWDRFRAFDAQRSAEHPALINELILRPVTPPEGVDVLFGRRQAMVDGSYHSLSGIPHVAAVSWLTAPADPECLEFSLVYPAGRFGGIRRFSLRMPVPAVAREDGVRVFWRYHVKAPQPRSGLVFQRPRAVFGTCIAVALTAAAIGGASAFACARGSCSEMMVGVAISGIATAGGALLVIAILAAVVWRSTPTRAPDA
jgi:hypothetical protein